jgi:hypothetical protein
MSDIGLADNKFQSQGGEVIAVNKVTVNQVVPRAGVVKGT